MADLDRLPAQMQKSLKAFHKRALEDEGKPQYNTMQLTGCAAANGEEVVAYYVRLYMVQLALTKSKEIEVADPAGANTAKGYAIG